MFVSVLKNVSRLLNFVFLSVILVIQQKSFPARGLRPLVGFGSPSVRRPEGLRLFEHRLGLVVVGQTVKSFRLTEKSPSRDRFLKALHFGYDIKMFEVG